MDEDGRVTMVAETRRNEIEVALRRLSDQVASLQRRIEDVAEDTRALREQLGVLASTRAPAKQPPKPKREGRKRGLAAVMGRIFWDRMMQGFAEEIRTRGPMTAAELYATLDDDALHMAEAAFEKIDLSLIAEKVEERVRRKNYFSKRPDGSYDVL